MKVRGRVARTAVGVAFGIAGLSAAAPATHAPLQRNIDGAAIARAVALGQSRDPAVRRRFHEAYVVPLGGVPLDRLEIVTEFRRVVLETENRVRAGDIDWGPRQAADMLQPWRDKLALTLHVTLPPNNLYRAMPPFEILLYGRPGTPQAGDAMRPLDMLETPRYIAGQPAPPGTPILGGTIQAIFSARPLDAGGVFLAGIGMDGRELRRVEIDLGRLE